jgi:hypothetical protein
MAVGQPLVPTRPILDDDLIQAYYDSDSDGVLAVGVPLIKCMPYSLCPSLAFQTRAYCQYSSSLSF